MNTYNYKIYFDNYNFVNSDINKNDTCLVKNTINNSLAIQKILPKHMYEIYEHLLNKQINHTPKIYGIKRSEDHCIILCEYIDGITLTDYINEKYVNKEYLDDSKFFKQIFALLRIVENLQKSKTIIHRDIKPDNIMITKNNELYLIDFGSAKIYKPNDKEDTYKLGTEKYAAPEQYGFGASNKSTDIYAIGKIIDDYTIIIKDKNLIEKIKIISNKCCKIDYKDRYKNINTLYSDLFKLKYGFFSFSLPGYRTFDFFHMTIATTSYILLIYFCFINTASSNFHLNITIFLSILLFILIFFNYLDIDRLIPFAKSKNIFIKYSCKLFFSMLSSIIVILLYVFI